ncbi:MAG: acetamidase [Clostridiales bacterium]|nr:acetamidase [Clostridiales bacterium]
MIIIESKYYVNSMDKANASVEKAKSGDTVVFVTKDCFGGQIQSEDQVMDSLDWSQINPATGPLYVEGACEGDVLKVEILNIEIADKGVMIDGGGEGVMGKLITDASTKILPIQDGKVIFNDKLAFPVNPMIGVIGTAPKGEGIPTGTPGDHGSNMDCTKIRKGATVYLPVNVDGALLAMGDLHALMGDGEVGVCGVETDGVVTVKITVLKNSKLPTPFIVDDKHAISVYSAETADEACEGATINMFNCLMNELHMTDHEAEMLLSVIGNVCICQIVDPERTARMEVPIGVFEAYGYKFA